IRPLPNQFQKLRFGLVVKFACGHACVWFGLDRTRLAIALQESNDGGKIDTKESSDFPLRMLTAVDGGHDTLPEIVGIGSHGRTSSGSCSPEVFRVHMRCHREPL